MSRTTHVLGTSPPVDEAAVRAVLLQHRQSRQDQVEAYAFAVVDPDPGVRLRGLAAAKAVLEEVEQALRRLDDGSYGWCTGCLDRIPAERLLAVPHTARCVTCASAR